ncbi:hypothetical protein SD80_015720 [Scytonema tolypothrichoides VB-61278]|nr:hypothetical protein SD80_015720 [Scytonema tolypothrichoides VB-61278]
MKNTAKKYCFLNWILYSYKCKQNKALTKQIPKQNKLVPRRNPMIISDLNYLENTSEEIFGGRGTNIANVNTTNVTSVISINETIVKTVVTNIGGVVGSTAEFTASADASGNNTFSSVTAGAQTEPGRSESFATGIAISRP